MLALGFCMIAGQVDIYMFGIYRFVVFSKQYFQSVSAFELEAVFSSLAKPEYAEFQTKLQGESMDQPGGKLSKWSKLKILNLFYEPILEQCPYVSNLVMACPPLPIFNKRDTNFLVNFNSQLGMAYSHLRKES